MKETIKTILRHTPWYGYALVAAVFLVSLAISGALFFGGARVQQNTAAIAQVNTALVALCAQRSDLDERIELTGQLLHKHPHSKLIFAIPRDLIVAGWKRDKNTRKNLAILDCKESP